METERILAEYATQQNIKKSQRHKTSGKISPSKLAYPSQTAILQLLGVPTDPFDDQILRIFQRGNEVENSVLRAYKRRYPQTSVQIPAEYRGAGGYIDIVADSIVEVKSVNKRKFETIKSQNKPQTSHAIQTAYYVLANNQKSGRLSYVCSDNLQAKDFTIYAEYWRDIVDYRIDVIYKSILDRRLPDFLPLETWHKSKYYTPYQMFYKSKGVQAEELLEIHYPEAYNKLKKGKLKKLCDKLSKDLITLPTKPNVSLTITQLLGTATSNCLENCASCSIRRLNAQYILTENSLVYYARCRHSIILRGLDGK